MGRKIFVSYKYSDSLVSRLSSVSIFDNTTARHYVDELTKTLKDNNDIFKGENDDESLDGFSDETIKSKLRDKIFDSSVSIILISKGMKETFKDEKDQWIPWEVTYSLRESSRNGVTSKINGVLTVVLPDENDSYEYFITKDEACNCRCLNTPTLFKILKDNMFNVKSPDRRDCNGSWVYSGDSSYIQSVKWGDFIGYPSKYIEKAIELRDRHDDFLIAKSFT